MNNESGRKTEQAHWDAAWSAPVRARIPSRLNLDVRNITDLLKRHVKPNSSYIEVGCAPGKYLAWVADQCQARTSGLDYSDTGIRNCQALFRAMNLDIDLHQGDFFNNALPKNSFDVVTSFGFIEHFDDPTEAVTKHIELLNPGGVALIAVPNYGGVYGSLQARVDPENLALHNTSIMNVKSLVALVEPGLGCVARAYPHGRASLWLVNLERKLPRFMARAIQLTANFLGHLQPWTAKGLAPMLVLEVRKKMA
jgi:2-polyprenyl-3-methyl-5-hydroxy-6-metoxy-1,4-benzoquinol methylase